MMQPESLVQHVLGRRRTTVSCDVTNRHASGTPGNKERNGFRAKQRLLAEELTSLTGVVRRCITLCRNQCK